MCLLPDVNSFFLPETPDPGSLSWCPTHSQPCPLSSMSCGQVPASVPKTGLEGWPRVPISDRGSPALSPPELWEEPALQGRQTQAHHATWPQAALSVLFLQQLQDGRRCALECRSREAQPRTFPPGWAGVKGLLWSQNQQMDVSSCKP